TLMHEGADALALLDHLGLERAAILGTSRGWLIAMGLGALARDRLLGVCLNDIGPDIDPGGLDAIMAYLGKPPAMKTLAEAAQLRGAYMQAIGFENVAPEVWQREVGFAYREAPEGLELTYDARLREAVEAMAEQELPDLWPLFASLKGLPLALIHGENSNLLHADTVARMRSDNPEMRVAEVPGRGHVPFLDEPQALAVIRAWIKDMA
ncbi:MAG TPA: alpha/beta hydrolase, partial [Aliiroseovarius sp.]|nr:alpha/beta hydrolase [Aliiroseovarius sp.]